ncbi:MAG: pyridoxal phosphate-dependent aminotransferase [Terriglobales bacterium]
MAASTATTQPLSNRINRIEVSATMAVVSEAERLRAGGADLVDFGAGEPHFATPQHIKDAAIAAINANFTKYTAVGGTVELRDAIIQRHAADFGSDYKREECIAATGGKQALFNAFQVLVEHGDEVIIPVPYWVSFNDMVRYSGGVPVFVRTDESKGFTLTAEMVERAITPRTRIILLNSPCNPSGAVISPDDLRAVVRLAAKRNILVMSDECYAYLDFTGHRFSLGSMTGERERLLIVGSLSKTYAMTGWRLGFALGPKWIIAAMQKLQSQSTSNPTSIVQKAAVAALNGPQDCLKDMTAEYIRLRDHILEGLRAIPGVKCAKPDGAFYVYPNISAYLKRDGGPKTAAEIAGRLLREAGVVTVPGEAFGTDEHIRVSYPTTMQNIDKGVQRMRKFFASL